MYVLGIDAGGTRTTCLLADGDGQVLAEAHGPGANLQSMGELEVEKVLHGLIAGALSSRPVVPAAICLGMAGVDRPGEADTVRDLLGRIGHRARLLVVNDALIALEAGLPGRPGVVVVSGTGSMVYGRNDAGRAARAGGWGHLLGDEGSGYWMGRQALRAVVRAADRRGQPTHLTALVLEHYGIADPRQLVQQVYAHGTRPTAVAELATAVERAAAAGDRVARQILDVAAHELAQAAGSVARRLDLVTGPVLLSGGIFHVVPGLTSRVVSWLGSELPGAPIERLDAEPARGAVQLALALAGDRLALPVYLDAPG